ncbi:tho2 protein [Rhizoctonia solani AG-1 IA]|uniref:THO complex subunit 2 n=1 Tax=Thanatephorus cucumeris (strain AG1-IA) TaxID=983506 RepID=L8WV25_THACA|nr:tho2 protein [Rhizoctonia solani AG-1 IA]
MAHNDVVTQVTGYARQWETGGKASWYGLKYLAPHVASILSDAESVRILSAAFFVLVSYVTISASRQPKDSVITPDGLNDFCLELIRTCPPQTPGSHKAPVAGSTISPQAARLSEIIVDVFWMLDSELEDASVEEARASAPGSEIPSALQTRASAANTQRTEDRQRMVELIRRLLTGVLDADHCRERLESVLVTAIKALFRQSSTIKQREAKLRTATFYKQTRYNLLREQSEGYSKLVAELYQSVGPSHDVSTGEPAETKARLVQRAQETWARIVALIGYFDLDPNRVVDVFLDCFEAHLTTHWAFFLELLRCSPWSRAKPHELLGSEDVGSNVMEHDTEPNWEGLNLDEVLEKAEGEPKTISDPGTPQGSQCGQLLGFKFAYYQSSAVIEQAPPKLYMLAALLIREGFIEIDDLYLHLEPTDEGMSEFEDRWNTSKPVVATLRSNALAMAAPLPEDGRGYRTQGSTSTQTKAVTTDSTQSKIPANQKARLVHALFCVGALRQGLSILSKFPWLTSAHSDIADALLRLLDVSFEPLYAPISLAQRSPRYAASNATARGKWTNAKAIVPITRTQQLTLAVPVPPPTFNSFFTFFYPRWHEWVPRLRSHGQLMNVGVPLLRHVGLLVHRNTALLTRLCRIGKAQLDASVDPETKLADPDVLKDWVDITRLFLLPSLSMQRSNSIFATEIWSLLCHADPTMRWGVYGEWQSGNVFAPRISPYADDEYDPDYETPEEKQEREARDAHARALETKDSAIRDLLKERRAEVARDTRDLMRRITDKNPTMFARLLAKLSHSNPTITFPAIMKQLMAYDNFAKAVVGTSKYLTVMEFDVFTYYLLEAFSDDDRVCSVSPCTNTLLMQSGTLPGLAAFAGQLCRRHPAFDSAHILNYMSHQLHNNRYDDLVILRNLINKMTNIDASMDALPDRLLVALRGGPLLQVEMLAPETRGAEGLTPMGQRSTARLLDSLRRTKLFGPMIVLLAKLRQTSAFANTERAKYPKTLGLILDECQAVLFQYLELLWKNTSHDEWAAVTPSITDLVEKYGIEFSIAMHILRPKLREAILRASETKGEPVDAESKPSKALETAEAAERRLKSELKLQSAKREQATPTPDSVGAEPTPEPPSEPNSTSPWHPILVPVIKEVSALLPERVLETIGAPFFVTFWQLSMYELAVPDASYTSVVTRLSNKIREPIPPQSRDARFLEERRKRMQQQVELLPQEMKRQMTAKSLTATRLRREKNFWFPLYPNQNDVASDFVHYCIHPRAVLTPLDADFCSHFLKLLAGMNLTTANCLKFYDLVFSGHISSLIFTCTEREARNYGRFLRGVLGDLGAWAKDEKVYKSEIVDKLLPSFMRVWQRTAGTPQRPVKPSDMTQWDTFRRVVGKWYGVIRIAQRTVLTTSTTIGDTDFFSQSCVECLESGEAMHIRNAIIVLTEVLPVFPLKEISHNAGPAIINGVRQLLEKETRPDLFNMAQSYHGQLNGRRSHWELEVRDAGFRVQNPVPVKPPVALGAKSTPSDSSTGSALKPTSSHAQVSTVNGTEHDAQKDVEMTPAPLPQPGVSQAPTTTAEPTQPISSAGAIAGEPESKSYVDSLPKPSIVKGRVQRDNGVASTPPPSSRDTSQLQNNSRTIEPPTEPRRSAPSAPRLDLAKLNGSEPSLAKPQPVQAQLSARSSRPPTPTGPRKHNSIDSPRLGRISMPGPIEPSSTATAQELRKFSVEKAAEKSTVAPTSSDRAPSRRSTPDGRRTPSPRPSRRNTSADSRVSERTRDKGRDRDRDRDRDRHDDREREKDKDREKDRDRDRRRSQTYHSNKTRSDRDKDHRKRDSEGSRVRGHEDDDGSSAKRHKSGSDEVKDAKNVTDTIATVANERKSEKRINTAAERKTRTGIVIVIVIATVTANAIGQTRTKIASGTATRERKKRKRKIDLGNETENAIAKRTGNVNEIGIMTVIEVGEACVGKTQLTRYGMGELEIDANADNNGVPIGPKQIQANSIAGLPAKPVDYDRSHELTREPQRNSPRMFEAPRPSDASFSESSRSLASRLNNPSIPQKRGPADDAGPRDTDRPAKMQRPRGPGGYGSGTFGAALQDVRGRRSERTDRMNRMDTYGQKLGEGKNIQGIRSQFFDHGLHNGLHPINATNIGNVRKHFYSRHGLFSLVRVTMWGRTNGCLQTKDAYKYELGNAVMYSIRSHPTVNAHPLLDANLGYKSPFVGHPQFDIDTPALHERHQFSARQNTQSAPFVDDSYPTFYGADFSNVGSTFNDLIQQRSRPYSNLCRHLSFGMVGDPLDTSVLLWTRAYPQGTGPDQSVPVCVRYQVYDKSVTMMCYPPMTYTQWAAVKVEARNLRPDTWYWYIFNDCTDPGVVSPVGRTRTIASANTPAQKVNGGKPLTLGVFSCSNYPFGFFNAYGYAAKSTDADIMVHLGDYIYEYEEGHCELNGLTVASNGTDRVFRAPLNRTVSDRELATLSDYRARLALYRTDESLAYNHQQFPWIQVWDDHEVADNSWKAGTADSNDTVSGCKYSPSGTCFSDRKLSAVRAYHEWIPIRQVALDDKLRIWRNFQIGKLLVCIFSSLVGHINSSATGPDYCSFPGNYDRDVTDVYYNTQYVDSIHKGENRSIMGLKQEKWLEQQLLNSKSRGAVWRIIGQQVVFTQLNLLGTIGLDSWDGYTANRKRILDLLYKRKIDNTGDSHANWVSDLALDPNDTTTYNPATGQGAIGVEFAGTAVSSPSPLGAGVSPLVADGVSKQLVASNPDLHWSEGSWRGFFTLSLAPKNLTLCYRFYAMRNLNTTNTEAFVSAEFHVTAGANKLSRPVAGGKVAAGALKGN